MLGYLFPKNKGEKSSCKKKNPKGVVAVFAPKKQIFFARYLPTNIKKLAHVESTKEGKGFVVRPRFNLVMSVTGLHDGGKGCCRVIFARMDLKKFGGKKLGFAKKIKPGLARRFFKEMGGEKLDAPLGVGNFLLYQGEVLIAKSLAAKKGGFAKETDLFDTSTSTAEEEIHEINRLPHAA